MTVCAEWQATLGLAQRGTRIDAIGDPASEAAQVGRTATKTPMTELGVVEISGEDACEFLHGQLSADCHRLAAGQSVLTAWCSPKGRVLYLLRVMRTPTGFTALLPHDQAPSFIKRLRMYVLRAKVEIIDRSGTFGVVRCDDATTVPSDAAGIISARDRTQTWRVGEFPALAADWVELHGTPVGEAAATLNDIRLGIARLPTAVDAEFLPQELNLDVNAGVSFEKGCYPGQEIIARVKFRGNVKRRLARLVGSGSQVPVAGSRLLDVNDQAVGTVLMAEQATAQSFEILAVVNNEADQVSLPEEPALALERRPVTYNVAG